jgi:hypothetical protein
MYIKGNLKQGSFVVVSLPYYLNPSAFISSVIKSSFGRALKISSAMRICYYVEGFGVCEKCGKPAMFDLFLNKDIPFCQSCYRKMLVIKLKKQIE